MPVLMDDSRFLTTAAMASRCSGVILPVATRLLINSSIASQRLVARKSVMICSLLRISPKSIATEPVRLCISPEAGGEFKLQLSFRHQILRSEEHTSELQSRQYLVCRLLLEKKNTQ